MKWEKLRIFTRPIKKIRHGSKFDYSRQTASPSVLIYPVTIEFCPANYLLTIIENSDRTAIAVLVVVCERKRRSYVQWRHQRGIWGGYATHFGNVRRTCRIFGENLTLSSEFWRKNVVIVVIYVGILIGFVGISFCRKLQPPPPTRQGLLTSLLMCVVHFRKTRNWVQYPVVTGDQIWRWSSYYEEECIHRLASFR